MSKLKLIIANEYLTDIRSKSFWIATFVVPFITILFGVFIGVLMGDSSSFMSLSRDLTPTPEEETMTGEKIIGMLVGIFLVFFIMMYGAQIFNKVKVEKCNRIVEVIATCVDGRTMMFAKIIAVGLIGLTQLFLWFGLVAIAAIGLITAFSVDFPWNLLIDGRVFNALIWSVLYFVGGYTFYGALFAAVGAMTDKNNENQEYVSVLTFILLGSFYIGEYAVDKGDSVLGIACSYIPFTASSVGAVNAITGVVPLWQSTLSVVVLFVFALLSLSFSGKLYTASLLLKGKRFTPRDIIVFLKAK